MRNMLLVLICMIIPTFIVSPKQNEIWCDSKYDIGVQLGHGGFGRVYEADYRDVPDDMKTWPLALKTFNGRDADTDFENEYNILDLLDRNFRSHGGTFRRFPHLYNACRHPHNEYYRKAIVTDGVPIGLEEWIWRERTTIDDDVHLIESLLQAVNQIHRLGIAHLDLKPTNIRIDNNHNVILIDFGLSTTLHGDHNFIVGSYEYMAPEMLHSDTTLDNQIDKVDTWSVGMIAYELLTREPLRDSQTVGGIKECLDERFEKQSLPSKYYSESLRTAIYIQTKVALPISGKYVEPLNPGSHTIDKITWECAFKGGFEAGPRLVLLEKLSEYVGQSNGKQLADLVFDKLLQINPQNRASLTNAIKDIRSYRADKHIDKNKKRIYRNRIPTKEHSIYEN